MGIEMIDPTSLIGASFTDWITAKTGVVEGIIRGGAGVIAAGFVAFRWLKSGGAMGSLIMAGVIAGLGFFLIWNITDLGDMAKQESRVEGPAPAPSSIVDPTAELVFRL